MRVHIVPTEGPNITAMAVTKAGVHMPIGLAVDSADAIVVGGATMRNLLMQKAPVEDATLRGCLRLPPADSIYINDRTLHELLAASVAGVAPATDDQRLLNDLAQMCEAQRAKLDRLEAMCAAYEKRATAAAAAPVTDDQRLSDLVHMCEAQRVKLDRLEATCAAREHPPSEASPSPHPIGELVFEVVGEKSIAVAFASTVEPDAAYQVFVISGAAARVGVVAKGTRGFRITLDVKCAGVALDCRVYRGANLVACGSFGAFTTLP